jgi:hypothetical protein
VNPHFDNQLKQGDPSSACQRIRDDIVLKGANYETINRVQKPTTSQTHYPILNQAGNREPRT